MTERLRTSLSVPKALADQASALAQQLELSRNQLFVIAITYFFEYGHGRSFLDGGWEFDQDQPDPTAGLDSSVLSNPAAQPSERRLINQGDIYWMQPSDLGGLQPGIRHPHVVIQDDVFNHCRMNSTVVCSITSNLKRASMPGNVLLNAGEGDLPSHSVVEVSKVSAVEATQLGAYIGTLPERRIQQILSGIHFLQSFYAVR